MRSPTGPIPGVVPGAHVQIPVAVAQYPTRRCGAGCILHGIGHRRSVLIPSNGVACYAGFAIRSTGPGQGDLGLGRPTISNVTTGRRNIFISHLSV